MPHVFCETDLFRTVRSVWYGLLSNPPFASIYFTPTEPCESVQGVLWQNVQFALTFYLHQMFAFLVSCWKRFGFLHDKLIHVCATSYLVKDFQETHVVLLRIVFVCRKQSKFFQEFEWRCNVGKKVHNDIMIIWSNLFFSLLQKVLIFLVVQQDQHKTACMGQLKRSHLFSIVRFGTLI